MNILIDTYKCVFRFVLCMYVIYLLLIRFFAKKCLRISICPSPTPTKSSESLQVQPRVKVGRPQTAVTKFVLI